VNFKGLLGGLVWGRCDTTGDLWAFVGRKGDTGGCTADRGKLSYMTMGDWEKRKGGRNHWKGRDCRCLGVKEGII